MISVERDVGDGDGDGGGGDGDGGDGDLVRDEVIGGGKKTSHRDSRH